MVSAVATATGIQTGGGDDDDDGGISNDDRIRIMNKVKDGSHGARAVPWDSTTKTLDSVNSNAKIAAII
jgi:hypothetical protein